LEEVLGCRWYTSFVSRIPKNKTICIDQLDIVSRPDFEYRESDYIDAQDPDWAARNRMNGNSARLDATRGGKIAYWGCHSFEYLVPIDTYYQEHPEYYSFTGDARVGGQYKGQLCLTNPDVLKIVTGTVLKWIAAYPEFKIISVSQNDNTNYCKCPNCAAVDAEEGITFMPPDIIVKCNALFDEAEKLADSPDVLARVKHARLSVRYVEVNRQVEAAALSSGTPEQKQAVKHALQVFVFDCAWDGITFLSGWNIPLQEWLYSKLARLK